MTHDTRAPSSQPAGADLLQRWSDKYGPPLRVPQSALSGEAKEEQPCLTPIDCVLEKRCAGHCGCR